MAVLASPTRFTADDLLRLEDEEGLYELVDGKLLEKPMSALASKTAGIIGGHLFVFLQKSPLGAQFPEQSFLCFASDPQLVRRPDIALIVAERLGGVPEEGHIPIAPDLVIEVVSPTDRIYELDEKLADYRAAGVKLVWVFNPKARTVRIHRPGKPIDELGEGDTLTGEPVLPGFRVRVAELLPAKVAVAD